LFVAFNDNLSGAAECTGNEDAADDNRSPGQASVGRLLKPALERRVAAINAAIATVRRAMRHEKK
jgi:hypothetical protein